MAELEQISTPVITARMQSIAVRCAAKCVLCLMKSGGRALENSQLKNLLEAATACQDTRSLQTWILYQMAKQPGWIEGRFGYEVIGMFEKAESPLRKALLETGSDTGDYSPTLMKLVAVFCGQLARLHRYLRRKDSDARYVEQLAGQEEAQ